LSLFVNLGLLGVFKYYNFFIENFVQLFSYFNVSLSTSTLNIILPVGISFYTFQTLSYVIDIYKNVLKPTNNFINFAAYVSFFPQLVAGPIERAINLLPQFGKQRSFKQDQAADGMRQILWGLFKKIVIADNCAIYADYIFGNSELLSGSTLLVGGIIFSIQIYCDFSGYSDIAIGTARLLGFELKQNFAYPFFSRNISEFWRRWHISMFSWFRDYIYIPLAGKKDSYLRRTRNIIILFFISGLWHGADWTFILWGLFNALLIIIHRINKNRNRYTEIVASEKTLPSLTEFAKIILTFFLFAIGLLIFRPENIPHMLQIFAELFSTSLFERPSINGELPSITPLLLITVIFFIIEWIGRREKHALEKFAIQQNRIFRYSFYYLLLFLIGWFGSNQQAFFYFQF